MPAVQFYGIDQVMEAAMNRACPCWGIFIGRNLFSKYEDIDLQTSMNLLLENLDVLAKSGTTGIYTLKFFECTGTEDNPKPVKINDRTPCDGGSFNFKLIEPEEREERSRQYQSSNALLEQKIAGLEKLIKEGNQSQEPQTFEEAAIEIVRDPDALMQYVNIFNAITGRPLANFAGIGGVNTNATRIGNGDQNQQQTPQQREEQVNRLAGALDTLEKKDPNLVEHLEKLAAMDETKLQNLLLMMKHL